MQQATPSATDEPLALHPLLRAVITNDGSDLHLKSGATPRIRMGGALRNLDLPAWQSDELLQAILQVLPPIYLERFTVAKEEVDFAVIVDGVRFRACAFYSLGEPGLVCRIIAKTAMSLESLRLPETIAKFASAHRGLVLVTGPTGSGKSTTLAAVIDLINQNRPAHIVTIEDPIEVLHTNKSGSITQREVGVDTATFHSALHSALRQDPDVILIGEMRDAETARAALAAAETGHLVLTTLHAADAQETITKFVDLFEPHEHRHVRNALSANLNGVVAQRLLPDSSGGQIAVCEIMVNTERISKAIADPESARGMNQDSIVDMIAQDRNHGMRTFDQALVTLVREQVIDTETAYSAATNVNDLRLALAHDPTDR